MKILIRHAEKAYANGDSLVLDKKHDPPLTESGKLSCIEKAKELVKLYGSPDIIITSPYRRCRETAQELAKSLDLEIKPTVEVKIAEYLGNHRKSKLDIEEETSTYNIIHPESWRQFLARIQEYATNLNKEYPNKIVWIVTHGVVIGNICKIVGKERKKSYEYLEYEVIE